MMAKSLRRERTAADDRHERAFALYRDMGPTRSLRKLAGVLKVRWPANHVSYTTLNTWVTRYGWGKRAAEYDLGRGRKDAAEPAKPDRLPATVDEVTTLRQAASQALALITPATQLPITRPADMKVLLDATRMARDLA